MRQVAILFARGDSVYKTLEGCDVYDIERDARTFPGGSPVVAHPPCRGWGKLRAFAKPRPDELALGPWAVAQVRAWGGVLEHPLSSTLWPYCGLPAPGARDAFGGFTLVIDQDWFGHKAEKRTKLYIVGVEPQDLPSFQLRIEEPTHVLASDKRAGPGRASPRLRKGMPGWRPEVSKAEREHTPPDLARWLVSVARTSKTQQQRMKEAA